MTSNEKYLPKWKKKNVEFWIEVENSKAMFPGPKSNETILKSFKITSWKA